MKDESQELIDQCLSFNCKSDNPFSAELECFNTTSSSIDLINKTEEIQMKLNQPKLKTVNYHGRDVDVPQWTICIATDSDGTTFAYSTNAIIIIKHDMEWGIAPCDELEFECEELKLFSHHIEDWKNSKVVYDS